MTHFSVINMYLENLKKMGKMSCKMLSYPGKSDLIETENMCRS